MDWWRRLELKKFWMLRFGKQPNLFLLDLLVKNLNLVVFALDIGLGKFLYRLPSGSFQAKAIFVFSLVVLLSCFCSEAVCSSIAIYEGEIWESPPRSYGMFFPGFNTKEFLMSLHSWRKACILHQARNIAQGTGERVKFHCIPMGSGVTIFRHSVVFCCNSQILRYSK